MSNKRADAGFSLFEVIIYIAIVAVLMVTVLAIAVESLTTRTKAAAMQNVSYETQFVLDRMTSDIRAAVDINETDLTLNILTITLADGTTHRYQNSSGHITLSVNGQTATALTSSAVTVINIVFSNRTTVGAEAKDIGLTLTLHSTTTNPRPEFNATQTLTTTVSARL